MKSVRYNCQSIEKGGQDDKIGTGLPGQGFDAAGAGELAGAQKKVFGKDWLAYGKPQAKAFEALR